MTRRIDRRQALGAFGTVSLGALLAACGSDRVETTDGGTATVEPENHDLARVRRSPTPS